jgi:hypothetical protein
MSLTLPELKEKLKQLDEVILCEVLDISSEELVDRFEDFIERDFDDLEAEFEEENEDE